MDDHPEPPAAIDRSAHLAAVHAAWATPLTIVAAAVEDVAKAQVQDVRRIVAGEQNEVYDVSFERAPSLIVKISHRGAEGLEREAWVLGLCEDRGVPAPRLHTLRQLDVGSETRSMLVMEKLPGERLSDISLPEGDLRRVLSEIGAWLAKLHAVPVRGFGYLDGSGVGYAATMDDWLTDSITVPAPVFEQAGRSMGLDAGAIRSWVAEIVDAFRAAPPRGVLVHNDVLPNHVLVHEGRLSGMIDFGEVAGEPAAIDFARWDFNEGERYPVEWIQAGYGDRSLFEPPNDRVYRALRLATGLWLMQWYDKTGFPAGVEAARDRLLRAPGQ